jgi:AcrR family transcriptional regulator
MPATKALRSDARRNREALVAAARELFAEAGTDVSVEAVTSRAGLGMGTLYRHFSTKDELVDAVLEDAFSEVVQVAERAAAEEDAWAGFRMFLEETLARHAANRGLKDLLAAHRRGRERAQAIRERLQPLLARLVERAQEQGALRPDFALEDLRVLFWSCARVVEITSAVAPGYWRRHLAFLLDGLQTGAATPLPAPPLTPQQLAIAAERAA